jgi:MinD superfamily P-loop ATPase
MSSLNFIGGEKGGVGKSVVARVLAQYFIDKNALFTGFDTDRSHTSFIRFYEDFASPVVIDSYESLDLVAAALEQNFSGKKQSVIVDLAAQTSSPLARWVKDSDLFAVMADMGVAVNFWHIADAGKDSVDLLAKLIDTFGAAPNYVIVKNLGRGSDFSQLEQSSALQKSLQLGARVVSLGLLQEASMRKIDRQNASFWAALNHPAGADALGLLERQRVKNWLKKTYDTFEALPL